jgi:hypothetical protein
MDGEYRNYGRLGKVFKIWQQHLNDSQWEEDLDVDENNIKTDLK